MKMIEQGEKVPTKGHIQESIELTGKIAYNGDMLKKYRLKLNLSQEQLANELGISVRTIRDIESGGQKRKRNKLLEANIKAWLREVSYMAEKSIQEKGVSTK